VGNGTGQKRLAAAGRTVQQDALWRLHAQAVEHLGVGQRQLDHLADLVDLALHAAEIVISDDVVAGPPFAAAGVLAAAARVVDRQ
jgi:hypothetical protein